MEKHTIQERIFLAKEKFLEAMEDNSITADSHLRLDNYFYDILDILEVER